jgi:hypothetical protein
MTPVLGGFQLFIPRSVSDCMKSWEEERSLKSKLLTLAAKRDQSVRSDERVSYNGYYPSFPNW